MDRDKLCSEIEIKIGKIIFKHKSKLRLRDILGILDITKHFFMMEKWEKL